MDVSFNVCGKLRSTVGHHVRTPLQDVARGLVNINGCTMNCILDRKMDALSAASGVRITLDHCA